MKQNQHICAVCNQTEAQSGKAIKPFHTVLTQLVDEQRITLLAPNSGFAHPDCINTGKDKKERGL